MAIVINILLTIHVLVSLLIIVLVLMQRPKSEGLGAAFGGGMTDNLFGAQGTNVLQTITRWLGFIFFALSLSLSVLYVKKQGTDRESSLQQRLLSAPVPAATPEAEAQQKIQEAIQKALEQQKNAPATTTDPASVAPEGTTPPTKPSEPAPAPAPGAPAPAAPAPAVPAPDAKAPAPAPATPEPAAK
jgi:preprotein translocase subunit SecG